MIMIDEKEEMITFLRDLKNQKIINVESDSENNLINRIVDVQPYTYIDALGIKKIYTDNTDDQNFKTLRFDLKNGKAVLFKDITSHQGSININKFLFALRQMAFFEIV